MALYPVVAGSRIYIGGTIADQADDYVEADFSGQTWVEIDLWQQMGDLGEDPNLITVSLINRNRDKVMKGTDQAVQMTNRFVPKEDDAGQIACIAAQADKDNDYAFRVVFPSGSERLFGASVITAREVGGEANTVRFFEVTIGRNTNIVSVAA